MGVNILVSECLKFSCFHFLSFIFSLFLPVSLFLSPIPLSHFLLSSFLPFLLHPNTSYCFYFTSLQLSHSLFAYRPLAVPCYRSPLSLVFLFRYMMYYVSFRNSWLKYYGCGSLHFSLFFLFPSSQLFFVRHFYGIFLFI